MTGGLAVKRLLQVVILLARNNLASIRSVLLFSPKIAVIFVICGLIICSDFGLYNNYFKAGF